MAGNVASAISLQSAYKEDEAALLIYVHAMNAALQDTLKEKQRSLEHLEDTREDWARKLQARHKEVGQIIDSQNRNGRVGLDLWRVSTNSQIAPLLQQS